MILPARQFYDFNPSREHQTGDIWSNLPTYGLLKSSHLTGIVITPACDLANNKVDTITYLPIIEITKMLQSEIFQPKILGAIKNLANGLNIDYLNRWLNTKWNENEIQDLIQRLQKINDKKINDNKNRVISGLKIIQDINSKEPTIFIKENFKILFGEKKINEILDSIIENSYASDITFVPPDNQDLKWSIVPNPSVIMFRYPLTAPIEIFDLALEIAEENWKKTLDNYPKNIPFIKEFSYCRPLKALRVNISFLHDLLTRFTILYSRLGSPSFSENMINNFKTEIK